MENSGGTMNEFGRNSMICNGWCWCINWGYVELWRKRATDRQMRPRCYHICGITTYILVLYIQQLAFFWTSKIHGKSIHHHHRKIFNCDAQTIAQFYIFIKLPWWCPQNYG